MKTANRQDEIVLKELEKRVWQDISRARASHAVLQQFLKPLNKKTSSHYGYRDVPLTAAIAHAAVHSIISALGRLLQPNPRDRESTISKYRNGVVKLLGKHTAPPGKSAHSIQSFNQLSSRDLIATLKREQKKFTEEILPLRNSLVAHSDIDFEWSLFERAEKFIMPCIEFVEKVHRTCRSAQQDAGNPGPYLDSRFESVAQDWIEALQARK